MIPNLETQVLIDVLWRNSFLEQAQLITELSAQDFKDEDFKHIFVVFSLILTKRTKIDALSIYDADKEVGIECSKWIESIPCSMADALKHVKMLKERNYRDEIKIDTSKLVQELINENNTDKFDEIKSKIVVDLSRRELDTGSKFINRVEITDRIDENMAKDAGLEGHSWGIADLDAFTSGIVTPRLHIVGGLKKTGKSRFVINTRYNLYKQGIPSVFLSLEMPGIEVTKLEYSRFTQIPDTHFRADGFMGAKEREAYVKIKKEIDWNMLPTECVSGINVHQVLSRLRMYKKLYGNPVIFIDYLQRIKHDRMRQAQELEEISNAIADATRLYDISIVLLSQLSNAGEREEASISQLKGSGGIGESGDTILLLTNLYRKSKNEADRGKFEILIEQRYGDSGIIKCAANLATSTYSDILSVEEEVKHDTLIPQQGRFWDVQGRDENERSEL